MKSAWLFSKIESWSQHTRYNTLVLGGIFLLSHETGMRENLHRKLCPKFVLRYFTTLSTHLISVVGGQDSVVDILDIIVYRVCFRNGTVVCARYNLETLCPNFLACLETPTKPWCSHWNSLPSFWFDFKHQLPVWKMFITFPLLHLRQSCLASGKHFSLKITNLQGNTEDCNHAPLTD